MTSEEVSPAQAAFAAWLRAARDAAGGGDLIGRRMQIFLRDNKLLDRVPEQWDFAFKHTTTAWRASYIAGWIRRAKPPVEKPLRDALIAAVTSFVDTPPDGVEGWRSFPMVVDEVHAERAGAHERGGRIARDNARAKKEEDDRLLLAVDPGPAAHLDAAALGLGSGILDGGVPRYLERTVDTEIARHLDGGSPGLTVIVGPPKAGKSRGAVEVLRSHLPDAVTWWVDSSPNTAPAVFERLSKTLAPPSVIVFDDAHRNGVNPTTGLTAELLRRLAERARIVLIVHDTDASGWAEGVSAGASLRLVAMLDAARIDYPIDLDAHELDAAAGQFDADGAILSRLGEHFASVTELQARAEDAHRAGDLRGCLVAAAIDATIAYPGGAAESEITQLTLRHLQLAAPNRRPPKAPELEAAFEWATDGIAPGSPHAILTRQADGSYRLFDALVDKLRRPDHDLTVLKGLQPRLPPRARAAVGGWLYARHQSAQAQEWWSAAAVDDDPTAMVNLAVLLRDRGDLPAAHDLFDRAERLGSPVVAVLRAQTDTDRTVPPAAPTEPATASPHALAMVHHAASDASAADASVRQVCVDRSGELWLSDIHVDGVVSDDRAAVVLSADGALAAADVADGFVVVPLSSFEHDPVVVRWSTLGVVTGTARVLSVSRVHASMVRLAFTDGRGIRTAVLGASRAWSAPSEVSDLPGVASAFATVDNLFVVTADGVGRWAYSADKHRPFRSLERIDGVDCIDIGAGIVAAAWGRDRRGAPRAMVQIRPHLSTQWRELAWRATGVTALGLVRVLAPEGSAPAIAQTVQIVMHTSAGTRVDEIDIERNRWTA